MPVPFPSVRFVGCFARVIHKGDPTSGIYSLHIIIIIITITTTITSIITIIIITLIIISSIISFFMNSQNPDSDGSTQARCPAGTVLERHRRTRFSGSFPCGFY